MALMLFTTNRIRALQSAQLIQGLRHTNKSDKCSASSITLLLSGAQEKGFTLLTVCHCIFSLLYAPAALLQLCVSLQDTAEHVPGHS